MLCFQNKPDVGSYASQIHKVLSKVHNNNFYKLLVLSVKLIFFIEEKKGKTSMFFYAGKPFQIKKQKPNK